MESNPWRERALGFIGGSLILVFCTFVYGQYRFQAYQEIFYTGFISGQWNDSAPAVKKK